jgi:hypothetical protein
MIGKKYGGNFDYFAGVECREFCVIYVDLSFEKDSKVKKWQR